MSDNRTDLPSTSAPNFNQRLRETIQTYLGRQGNPLDRGLTLRDLIESGIVKLRDGFTLRPGQATVPIEPGPGVVDTYEPDLTPPPTPSGFKATAGISNLIIEHDAPIYTQGHGHLRTRLYGKIVNTGDPLPTFADAAEIAQFSGAVYAHPSNPATTWRLWIKWETVDGVLSATPAGGTNGLAVTTGQDVSSLLTALTGEITESQLYQALQSRINLVDGPDTLSGSVAARIKTLSSTVNNNTTAIQTEATTRANADNSLFAQYTVKIDTNGFVSGFGLSSQTVNGVPVSDFQIRSDRFSITNPSVSLVTVSSLTRSTTTATLTTSTAHGLVVGDTFTLRGVTNDTNWNGAYTVLTRPSTTQITFTVANNLTTPATGTMKVGKTAIPFIVDGGVVYMASAMIKDATITAAKIADLAVDNAKIANVAADKLTAGSIAVGQHIQSAGYVAGSAGWRINGDGNAEFSNATVRGTVYATNGQFWGTLLGGAASSYSSGLGFYAGGGTTADGTNYRWRVGSPTGARIQWNGSAVEVYNSSNQLAFSSGGITASQVSGLGTLATQNSVSTGQVTGLGSLATQSSVNWSTQITNIPEFGNFAYLSSITSANISTYIAGAAIGTAYIADAAITQAKIGSAAVGSAQIADAAITTAKIGTAQIDTLRLAGRSVTFPQSAYTGGMVSSTSELTLQTLTVSSTGEPALLVFSSYVYCSTKEVLTFNLYRDGSRIYTAGGGANYYQQIGGEQVVCGTVIDQPAAGTHTYTMTIGNSGTTAGLWGSSRCMTYLECKR